MATMTLNHNYIPNDFLFVMACDRTAGDLLKAYDADRTPRMDPQDASRFSLRKLFRRK